MGVCILMPLEDGTLAYCRIRRGKLVIIPRYWRGKTPAKSRIKARLSKGTRKERRRWGECNWRVANPFIHKTTTTKLGPTSRAEEQRQAIEDQTDE